MLKQLVSAAKEHPKLFSTLIPSEVDSVNDIKTSYYGNNKKQKQELNLRTVFNKRIDAKSERTCESLQDYLSGQINAKAIAGLVGKGSISFSHIATFQKAQMFGATPENVKEFFISAKFPTYSDGTPAYKVIKKNN